MIILYIVKNGIYINFNDILKEEKNIKYNVYVNLINKCFCVCIFCLRNIKEMDKLNSLWLDRELIFDEVIFEFKKYDLNNFNEIIFCGFGEFIMVFDILFKIVIYLKNKNFNFLICININGLCDLVYKKEIVLLFKELVDIILISLNVFNVKDYLNLICNNFGFEFFDVMLKFVVNCKIYILNVVMIVVDCIG